MILADEAATVAFGTKLAEILKPGDAIGLSGDLGAGKTVLARGVLTALGLEGEVPSPTFAIVQPYEPPETQLPVWHIDLYRLDEPSDADELGLDDARRDVAMLIEWPDRLGDRLWDDVLRLQLTVEPQTSGQSAVRRLTATVPQCWESRWPLA